MASWSELSLLTCVSLMSPQSSQVLTRLLYVSPLFALLCLLTVSVWACVWANGAYRLTAMGMVALVSPGTADFHFHLPTAYDLGPPLLAGLLTLRSPGDWSLFSCCSVILCIYHIASPLLQILIWLCQSALPVVKPPWPHEERVIWIQTCEIWVCLPVHRSVEKHWIPTCILTCEKLWELTWNCTGVNLPETATCESSEHLQAKWPLWFMD